MPAQAGYSCVKGNARGSRLTRHQALPANQLNYNIARATSVSTSNCAAELVEL